LADRRPEENVDASLEIRISPPKSRKIKHKSAVELYSEMERSAAFFEVRFAEAFPGWRENLVVSDPQKACDHLVRLLRAPLSASNEKFTAHPIWWWRGHENMSIDKIRRVGFDQKGLLLCFR
jgi:hypothetical protein